MYVPEDAVLVLLVELAEAVPIPALLVNSFKRFKSQITQNKLQKRPGPGHPANRASTKTLTNIPAIQQLFTKPLHC